VVIKQGDGILRFFLDGRGGFKITPVRIEKRQDGAWFCVGVPGWGQACVIVVIAKGRNNYNNAGLTPFMVCY
jgi:hypothetical protein